MLDLQNKPGVFLASVAKPAMELWNIESIRSTKAWVGDKRSFLKMPDLTSFLFYFILLAGEYGDQEGC